METLQQLTDEKLVKLYESGNNEAFEILLLRHKNQVYNHIHFITKNRTLTEEIFQETFIKAIISIRKGNYTENGKFLAWINRIAHNLIIDHFRKTSYENTFSNDDNEYDILNNAKLCEESFENLLVRKQQLTEIVNLLEFLPDTQKEVLKMRYYEDLSFNEIAEKTGVSINTALGRMRYALMNLKKLAKERTLIFD